MAAIHDWAGSARQELNTMLAGSGEAQTRAHGRGGLLFGFTFEEQTSDTPVDRFTAQQHVCSAEQKENPEAYSFPAASQLHWEHVAPA